jgi:hypothetical protein
LAEAVAGNEAVKGAVRIELIGIVVPAAHVVAGRGLAGALAEGLEQRVLVEAEEEGVVGVELLTHEAFKQLDVAVFKLLERRVDCWLTGRIGEGGARVRKRSGGEGGACLQETSAGVGHGISPFDCGGE